jgi:hypothetical protein
VGGAPGDHFKIVPEDEKERGFKLRYRKIDLFAKADPCMRYYEPDKRKAGGKIIKIVMCGFRLHGNNGVKACFLKVMEQTAPGIASAPVQQYNGKPCCIMPFSGSDNSI